MSDVEVATLLIGVLGLLCGLFGAVAGAQRSRDALAGAGGGSRLLDALAGVNEMLERARGALRARSTQDTPVKANEMQEAAPKPLQAFRPLAYHLARQRGSPLKTKGFWEFPPFSLLRPAQPRSETGPSEAVLQENARLLEKFLNDYGVQGAIRAIRLGPVVTLYELEPALGVKSSRIIGLANDIARSLSVVAVRIATVAGRNVINPNYG